MGSNCVGAGLPEVLALPEDSALLQVVQQAAAATMLYSEDLCESDCDVPLLSCLHEPLLTESVRLCVNAYTGRVQVITGASSPHSIHAGQMQPQGFGMTKPYNGLSQKGSTGFMSHHAQESYSAYSIGAHLNCSA